MIFLSVGFAFSDFHISEKPDMICSQQKQVSNRQYSGNYFMVSISSLSFDKTLFTNWDISIFFKADKFRK